MCNIGDAQTHEQLAQIQLIKNPHGSHEHYLEAASIYTLLCSQQKDASLLVLANKCYQKAHALKNVTVSDLSVSELAKRTLAELDVINKHRAEHARAHMRGIPHHN